MSATCIFQKKTDATENSSEMILKFSLQSLTYQVSFLTETTLDELLLELIISIFIFVVQTAILT